MGKYNLNQIKEITSALLVPLRGTCPVASTLVGRALLSREKSKRVLEQEKGPILFCAQKNHVEDPKIEDLYLIGMLSIVSATREEQSGIKALYESILPVQITNIYEKQNVLWADFKTERTWFHEVSVGQYWGQAENLISLFRKSIIGEKWDFIKFAAEDIESGTVPGFKGELLMWFCGNLLDERIFTVPQRQGLLEASTPEEALDYVKTVATDHLAQFNDISVFDKPYIFEKS